MQESFRFWIKCNYIEFALPAATGETANMNISSNKVAAEFVPFSNELL